MMLPELQLLYAKLHRAYLTIGLEAVEDKNYISDQDLIKALLVLFEKYESKVSDLINDKKGSFEYEQLEKELQQHEAQNRHHIRLEQQMKLYSESLATKVQQLERTNLEMKNTIEKLKSENALSETNRFAIKQKDINLTEKSISKARVVTNHNYGTENRVVRREGYSSKQILNASVLGSSLMHREGQEQRNKSITNMSHTNPMLRRSSKLGSIHVLQQKKQCSMYTRC